MGRTPCCEKEGLKKGPWTPDEDQKLISFIVQHGHGNWRALPKKCGLLRCGKSCRLRWTNYLRPDIKRGQFTYSEEQKIIHLHALLGNKWAFIASQLPKRTDNEIKNHWNTVLKKRLQKMGLNEVVHQQKGPDSVSSSESKPGGSSLSHLVQWESARLEAEARLAKESQMRAKGSWAGIPFKAGSSAPPHAHHMPSKLPDALLKQSGPRGMHPRSFASSLENSLQMNQMLRATTISSPSGSPLSSESVELRPAKSNLSTVQDFNSALKLTSNGSITWNSQELLPKDSVTTDFRRFSKLCSETLDEGAESDPRHLYALEKALQNVTKGEQLFPPDGGTCNAFSDLHELLFGDDSGSCLSPTSTAPWSQSSRHDASVHGSGTDMEEARESEVTMTTLSQLILQEETPRHARVKTSAPKVNICLSVKDFMELEVDKARPHSFVLKENEDAKDSLQLLQYDAIDEENSSNWNNFFSQLVDSPCARPLSNSVTLGHGIAGV